jgi:hypothetical protein
MRQNLAQMPESHKDLAYLGQQLQETRRFSQNRRTTNLAKYMILQRDLIETERLFNSTERP